MRSFRLNNRLVAVTMGDTAGIGPEVTLKSLSSSRVSKKNVFLVIGSLPALTDAAKIAKLTVRINEITPTDLLSGKARFSKKNINLLPVGCQEKYNYGRAHPRCGRGALEYIDIALDLIKKGIARAMVTAPVNKAAINHAGIRFTGHTEYLASRSGAKSVAMMFASRNIKLVLATRHISHREVSSALTVEKIFKPAMLLNEHLRKYYKIKNPRIGILGLNPHAGEDRTLGMEEKKIIEPAMKKLKKKIPHVCGPVAADSAFIDKLNHKYDALVCMYHDQAMIPLKTLDRNSAVNITLGLPYPRTSPVHGTAYDIAGKGKADPSSMISALNMASRLC